MSKSIVSPEDVIHQKAVKAFVDGCKNMKSMPRLIDAKREMLSLKEEASKLPVTEDSSCVISQIESFSVSLTTLIIS